MKPETNHARDVVVVTGSSGYIGSAVVERLAETFTVVGFDRETSPHPPAAAECICVDVTSDESVAAGMERLRTAYGDRIASVIHLAAYFDLSGEENPKYESVTVRGSERLLRAFQDVELEQFVFVSTMLVHAPTRRGVPIDEEAPLDDRALPYRQSKRRTEQVLRKQHDDIPLVILRPAGVYDDMGHSAFLANQVARIYERRLIGHLYSGDLDTGQAFLHLDDLTDALVRVVEHRTELPVEQTLLLGEGEAMAFDEIQRELGRLIHGEHWQTLEVPQGLARTGAWIQTEVLDEDPFIKPWMVDISSDHYEIDTQCARDLLSWAPRHSLRDTLPVMVESLQRDPVAWYRANKLNSARVAARGVEALVHAGHDTDVQSDGPGDATAEGDEGSSVPSRTESVEGNCGEAMKPRKGKMEDHMQGMRKAHFDLLWVHYLNMLLGAWLLSSPFVFGSFQPGDFTASVLRVTQERGLQAPELRSAMLGWSDVISGLLIMLFSTVSLSRRHRWAQWANTSVGIWLLFAPLLFWAPSAAVYANDTLVGGLVITFAIMVPMMPGMGMTGMMDSSDLPSGWNYSPSTYLQRLPIIALGAFGLLVARHLAAYQLGHIDSAWEPFFGGIGSGLNGTEAIITSDVSKAWPVADGGLGATVYMFEVLMGVMGGRSRWRTMPWMVAGFGVLVVPLGVISIYFIIIQPVVIGTWCSLCLLTALAMLIMIPYSLDEVVAMGQYLVQSSRRGEPFWRTFFKGGAQPDGKRGDTPGFDAPIHQAVSSAVRGVTWPWTLTVSALIGVALMFTRLLFGTQQSMADSDHVVGALIVTAAVIAMAEVARPLRFLNVLFGFWLIAAPWILDGASAMASWMGVLAGIAVIAMSLPRGPRSNAHYGSWDRYIV